MSIYQREISKKSPTRQTWKIRSMSYMGDSVHNVCQKGCMNVNWNSLCLYYLKFTLPVLKVNIMPSAVCV